MALPATRRFTVDDYYKMAEVGILTEDDRVELIEGEILQMAPIGPLHSGELDDLMMLFIERLRGAARVRIQQPVRLGRQSEPEPDLAIVRTESERERSYKLDHPMPEDVFLIVEVADSSLAYDLGRKARMYARAGIADLWVLDQRNARLVVHRSPGPRGYTDVRSLERGASLAPLAFSEIVLTIDEVLGAPLPPLDEGA